MVDQSNQKCKAEVKENIAKKFLRFRIWAHWECSSRSLRSLRPKAEPERGVRVRKNEF